MCAVLRKKAKNIKKFLMSKSYLLVLAAIMSPLLSSCIKDEPLNAECDIEQAWLHTSQPEAIFVKATDSTATVNEAAHVVTFKVRKGTDMTSFAPMFTITPGATISPDNGSAHDFSKDGVNYTVTSEDRAWSKTYNVRFSDGGFFPSNLDFEKYYPENGRERYYIWTDVADNGEDMLNWASGNGGFAIVGGDATPYEYPTSPYDNGYDGKAVKLTTRATGPAGDVFKMPIAAGNLFTGSFKVNTATKKPLESTHFGEGPFCVVDKKPVKFTGYYQYSPGTEITNRKKEHVDGVDQGDMYAVLFRNTTPDGKPFYLDGTNVKTSPQIVALALAGPVDKTPDGKWQEFSADFNYIANFDEQVLKSYGYSLAVVFTSSVGGADFIGAVGSELLIDKVRIVME